jgi:hypothetical protein
LSEIQALLFTFDPSNEINHLHVGTVCGTKGAMFSHICIDRRHSHATPHPGRLAALATALAPRFRPVGRNPHRPRYSKTGPLEAYGKQTQTGLMMGLDYATGGTMAVAARRSW